MSHISHLKLPYQRNRPDKRMAYVKEIRYRYHVNIYMLLGDFLSIVCPPVPSDVWVHRFEYLVSPAVKDCHLKHFHTFHPAPVKHLIQIISVWSKSIGNIQIEFTIYVNCNIIGSNRSAAGVSNSYRISGG